MGRGPGSSQEVQLKLTNVGCSTEVHVSNATCLYFKLAKKIGLSYYLLYFLFNKIEEGGTGSAQKAECGGMRWYKQCILM
jgi:hypothetical protein